ncbi:MAG TPA: diacylglycerol kinase family protein [Dehalococcoidia bacterium]|nr:diacylglycerol kinase family protein [Dehalococcoidia bacterium]
MIDKKALVIVNPTAHNLPAQEALEETDEWLRAQGWQVRWEVTQEPGHATELARGAAEEDLSVVFACGGDGTLREAAGGLVGSRTALGMIPAGTVNIWARETKIPRKPLGAVKALLSGEKRWVDLGKAGEHYFLLMAGYGLDGAISKRVSLRAKRRAGASAYALAALREALGYRGKPLTLFLDGEHEQITTTALMLVLGNTRNYAGLVEVTPKAYVDDGLMDVCLFQGRGLIDILLQGLGVVLRRHVRSARVIYRRARRIELQWSEPFPMQLDGDTVNDAVRVIEVAPRSLLVLVPEKGKKAPIFLP